MGTIQSLDFENQLSLAATGMPRIRPEAAPEQTLPCAVSDTYVMIKRGLDILIAGLLLLLLLPLMLFIAMIILIEDGRPVLFCQDRTGRDGNPFRFYKFRTMVPQADALKFRLATYNEADGPVFKMKRDPRVTHVGRWLRRSSLDELPQLLNILRGEMSLVGPRPLPVAEAARCSRRQQQRHLVSPGLLCLREVSGRSNLSFERWMELDLIYIQRRSFWLDMMILARALPAVLRGDGAY
jgi:lipopolysaccharide/colanic/teichoic acid biosynthesis glycosyltransferase